MFSSFSLETSAHYKMGCNRLRPEPAVWQLGAHGTPVNHRCDCRSRSWACSRWNSASADCRAADCFWTLASRSQWFRRHSPVAGSYNHSSSPSFTRKSRPTASLCPHNAPEESSNTSIGLIFTTHQPLPHHRRREPPARGIKPPVFGNAHPCVDVTSFVGVPAPGAL